jgi:hypothetical protein
VSQPGPSGTPDTGRSLARAAFAATALVGAAGLALQTLLTGRAGAAAALEAWTYFTMQANLVVASTTLLLALHPGLRSPLFDALRFTGLVAIAGTAVIFHVALADTGTGSLPDAVANLLLHTATPALALGGWVAWGPSGTATRRAVALSLLFPTAWAASALVRGAIDGVYPYPFMDVTELGYGSVLTNVVGVSAVFAALAAIGVAVDHRRGAIVRAPGAVSSTPVRSRGTTQDTSRR